MHGGFITFNQWIQRQRRNEQHGVGALFAIEYQMRIVGQISLGGDFLRIHAHRCGWLLG